MKNKESELKKWDDQTLVSAILNAKDRVEQRRLQEELYRRYAEFVYFKCLGIVKDKDVAKDLSHDIFMKIFLKLKNFKGTGPFGGWVSSIVYNHSISYLKKEKRLRTEEIPPTAFNLAIDDIEQEHQELKELRLQQLEKLLEELNESDRLVLLMRYQEEHSVKQIASLLSLSESAVKMRLKRSRDRLAELFKNLDNEEG